MVIEREREIVLTSISFPERHKGGSAWISRNDARRSFEYSAGLSGGPGCKSLFQPGLFDAKF